jgi:hypothetical protein
MMASAGEPGAKTGPNALVRVARAWRALAREQRVSALAAMALFITMFLPWYSVTAGSRGIGSASLSAWSAFGLVQAIVLAISLGTLALLFVRGERRALGGEPRDTAVLVLSGGSLAAILILYAMFDRPGGSQAVASGISWGIVIALLAAVWLAWTGFVSVRDRRVASAAGADADAPVERQPTRRERRGDGDTPEAARWVDPATPRRTDAARNRETAPPEPAAPLGGALRRDDASQLSFELPRDHFDE